MKRLAPEKKRALAMSKMKKSHGASEVEAKVASSPKREGTK